MHPQPRGRFQRLLKPAIELEELRQQLSLNSNLT